MVEYIPMHASNDGPHQRAAAYPESQFFGLSNEINLLNQQAKHEHWSVSLGPWQDKRIIFERGLEVLCNSGPMLVAVCLNNGYYTRDRIKHLLEFASRFSDQVTIFFTDGPAVHNYIAWGSDRDSALRKARKQRNRLQNACLEAVERISHHNPFEVSFIDWTDVYRRSDYKQEYDYLRRLFSSSSEFSSDLIRETTQALNSQGPAREEAIEIASEYPLEELAFLLTYNKIAAELAGKRSPVDFAYVYHLQWPLLENLVEGKYDGHVRSNLGFIILKITENLRLVHSDR